MWINNCVGHKNYKAFFLFLFFNACSGLYGFLAVPLFSLVSFVLCVLSGLLAKYVYCFRSWLNIKHAKFDEH